MALLGGCHVQKFRIVTLSGAGLPETVPSDGYESRETAEGMAVAYHVGTYRVEPYNVVELKTETED